MLIYGLGGVINKIMPFIMLLMAWQYTLALALEALLSVILLFTIFGALNHQWFHPKIFHKEFLKPLFVIVLPIVTNLLVYWISIPVTG